LGVNESLGQRVAVKFLSHKFTADERVILRFLNEARSYCKVSHPNAVTLLEYGQHDNGSLYLITEFIEGKSLTDTIKDIGPMSVEQIVSLGIQCCQVLSAAHSQGVIHRDLKPDNIMLVPAARGRYAVKVLDFGIAKIIDDDEGHGPMTETGSIFGTPEFMSPEQARGEGADPRSDLYAMGVILFFVTTGKLPFRGKNKFAVLNKHLNEKPPRPTQVREDLDISLPLEAVILKCLNKMAEERYPTADDLSEALEELESSPRSSTVPVRLNRTLQQSSGPVGPLGDDGFQDVEGSGVSMEMSNSAVDVHAETLGADISESAWDEINLDSVDLTGEGRRPRANRSGSERVYRVEPSLGKPLRRRAATAAAVLILIGIVAVWHLSQTEPDSSSGEDSADILAEIQTVMLTGQVVGLLQAVEHMISAGELDGARESLGTAQGWMKDGGVSDEAEEMFKLLSTRQQTAANLQTQLRGLVSAGRCDDAKEMLVRLQDISKGTGERLAHDVRHCGRKRQERAESAGTARPTSAVETPPRQEITTPEPEPTQVEAPKVEPPEPEPPRVEAPVIEPIQPEPPKPEPAAEKIPEDVVEPKPSQDAESSEPDEDEVPDGMALPPRQL
ncbi:MAG: serine/threonine-protein kinase, partial [Bradymonadaceae bacterium]